ncbi:MAG: DUF1501 domain-containing protein [Fimbriimonadaceae bacterium]|nr:DUF1501 domain-containing protein [Fimbriimonadaceae bacterium]
MADRELHSWTSCDGDGRLNGSIAGLTRRQMLAVGMGGLASLFGAGTAWSQAVVQNRPQHDRVLVVIFLRGGADALNIAAPIHEQEYHDGRPTLRLTKTLPLDDRFGLHPSLEPLHRLYKEGMGAFVHACGSQDETRSHFSAMATMEAGRITETSTGAGGWLGRHLASTPGSRSPLRAVALGSILPDSLGGAAGSLAVEDVTRFRLSEEAARAGADLARLYAKGHDPLTSAGRDTLGVLKELEQAASGGISPENGAEYPETSLGQGLKQAAFLVRSRLGLEVACLDHGGWDTHVAQGAETGWQATLLDEVARSVAAFFRDLGPESERVTRIVQSEFGRRIYENAGLGTDHGRGGVMMLFGGGVQGGRIHADWPGLSPADRVGPGDLRVTTDYRQILAEILTKRLATADLNRVFPGLTPRPLGLIRA